MKWTIARLFVYGVGAGFFICAAVVEYVQGSYVASFAFFLLAAALSANGLLDTKKLSDSLYIGDGMWSNPFRPVDMDSITERSAEEDDSEEKKVE